MPRKRKEDSQSSSSCTLSSIEDYISENELKLEVGEPKKKKKNKRIPARLKQFLSDSESDATKNNGSMDPFLPSVADCCRGKKP